MKKIITFICFIFFTISSFAIKVENNQIVDDYGNKIEAKEYKKIIVTDPGVIEILFKIGGEKSIVAIAKTSRSKIYPSDKVDKLVSIGNVSNLNLEKVVEYKPDLIVVSSMMLRNVEAIKKMGYKVIVSNAPDLNGILDTISVTGIISGKKDEAEKLRKECSLKLEKIEKENEKNTSTQQSGESLELGMRNIHWDEREERFVVAVKRGGKWFKARAKTLEQAIEKREQKLREAEDFAAASKLLKKIK